MNRRGFLKAFASISAALAMPVPLAYGIIKERWINILRFGAVGDGITDDTAAFKVAMDYAIEHGIAEIRVPPGIYKVIGLPGNDKVMLRQDDSLPRHLWMHGEDGEG